MKLAELRFAAANGVLFVEDADREPGGAPLDIGESAVIASEDLVIVRVLPAIDGLVTASVCDQHPEDVPVECYSGRLAVQHGRLRVRDVSGENMITVGVDPGIVQIEVLADSEATPERVAVLVPAVS